MADTKSSLLITRPEEDAQKLATLLKVENIPCIISPVLKIIPVMGTTENIGNVIESASPSVIIVTSRHTLPALSGISACISLPLLAVGSNTAQIAKELGFNKTHPPAANVAELMQYLLSTFPPDEGSLLYASGTHTSLNIKRLLENKGYTIEQITVYEAEAARNLSPECIDGIRQGSITGVLFFSLRTLKIFTELAANNGLLEDLTKINALCLSDNIASHARNTYWKSITAASSADETGMLGLVRNTYN